MYNECKELKELTVGNAIKKARKTTLEERICIVKDCLDPDRNYGAMPLKYGCSYQHVQSWVCRYEKWAVRAWKIEGAGASIPSQIALRKSNYETASQSWSVKTKISR